MALNADQIYLTTYWVVTHWIVKKWTRVRFLAKDRIKGDGVCKYLSRIIWFCVLVCDRLLFRFVLVKLRHRGKPGVCIYQLNAVLMYVFATCFCVLWCSAVMRGSLLIILIVCDCCVWRQQIKSILFLIITTIERICTDRHYSRPVLMNTCVKNKN